ncbi:MAG: hypothetical protein FJ356_01855 [Thaumarchaeota archaeon]|nr:hypothetical protein [Nitrososphaerota archaeon]
MQFSRNILIGIVAGIITTATLIATSDFTKVDAQMGGSHDMGGMHDGTMMGSQGHQNLPGSVQQSCHQAGSMPPHYCEPYYNTMSSVRGLRIGNVDVQNDNTLSVTVRQIATNAGTVDQKIVVAGGTGYLAGATIVEGGWSDTKTITITFEGLGTLYDQGSVHLHIFPITS